jgi:serine/threonine protein kinase
MSMMSFSSSLSGRSFSELPVIPMSISQTSVDLNETVPMEIVEEVYVPPRTIHSYEIIRNLGQGGQGRVELARVRETGQLIALKIVNIKNQQILDEVNKELSALEQLSTPNCNFLISCYYSHFYDPINRQMLIEMEYIDGVDLDVWCGKYRASGNLTALYHNLVLLTVDMCRALEYVHGKRLIHRDIKPSNILITQSNAPKLIDFGLSCNPTLCPNTVPGQVHACCYGNAGTPIFMAPETISKSQTYYSSDVWSLGGTLFKCAAGIYAFPMPQPNNIQLILQTIVNTEPFVLQTSNALLDKVVNSCLNKVPENRPTVATILSWLV